MESFVEKDSLEAIAHRFKRKGEELCPKSDAFSHTLFMGHTPEKDKRQKPQRDYPVRKLNFNV